MYLSFRTPIGGKPLHTGSPEKGPLNVCVCVCTDVDECGEGGAASCSVLATCTNTVGGYVCICQRGYTGNGTVCTGPTPHHTRALLTLLYPVAPPGGKGEKLPPYGWKSKNYVICVCFHCHGTSYHTTNTLQGRRAKSHVDTQTIQPGLGDFVL